MTPAPAFRRFALAYATGFALIYVIARVRGLALLTVYPSLGIVLLGITVPAISPIPQWTFWHPRCGGTAGPPQPHSARL